jgi:uncharacterized Zn finger protein
MWTTHTAAKVEAEKVRHSLKMAETTQSNQYERTIMEFEHKRNMDTIRYEWEVKKLELEAKRTDIENARQSMLSQLELGRGLQGLALAGLQSRLQSTRDTFNEMRDNYLDIVTLLENQKQSLFAGYFDCRDKLGADHKLTITAEEKLLEAISNVSNQIGIATKVLNDLWEESTRLNYMALNDFNEEMNSINIDVRLLLSLDPRVLNNKKSGFTYSELENIKQVTHSGQLACQQSIVHAVQEIRSHWG